MKTVSFAPLEPVLSIDTLAKLFLSDRVIFADNLKYNKRHKYNLVDINSVNQFTFPVIKTNDYYKNVKFDQSQNYSIKFNQILANQFGHFDYAPFFIDSISKAIIEKISLFELHQFWIELFIKLYSIDSEIKYSTDYQSEFNIEEFPNIDKNYIPLLEKSYHSYADSLEIKYQSFEYELLKPDLYSEDLNKESSSLFLFFEFGPYLNRLFSIA